MIPKKQERAGATAHVKALVDLVLLDSIMCYFLVPGPWRTDSSPIRKNPKQLLNTKNVCKEPRAALIRQKRTFSMPQLISVSFSNGENLPL